MGTALGVSSGGVVLALFPASAPVQWLVHDPIDPTFFPADADLTLLTPYREWLFAVLGASLAGWGGLMAFVIRGPFRRGRPWAWTALASTLLLWFFLDTVLSLAHAVLYNAWVNGVLFLGFAIPLGLTRRFFLAASQDGALNRSITATNQGPTTGS